MYVIVIYGGWGLVTIACWWLKTVNLYNYVKGERSHLAVIVSYWKLHLWSALAYFTSYCYTCLPSHAGVWRCHWYAEWTGVYVYLCVCLCVCNVCACVSVLECIVYLFMFVYVCVLVCIYSCVCGYLCACVCVDVCMWMCVDGCVWMDVCTLVVKYKQDSSTSPSLPQCAHLTGGCDTVWWWNWNWRNRWTRLSQTWWALSLMFCFCLKTSFGSAINCCVCIHM